MTEINIPPGKDELEVTLFGPGYGESIVMHTGDGAWVLVDSCIDQAGEPRALQYLTDLGVDPARDVHLVIATHWHDDHIRGMARLVTTCSKANFCCAIVLCKKEFLAVVGALEQRRLSDIGSGVRELYEVFSRLQATAAKPVLAIAGRRIFSQGSCEIWALSPNDAAFLSFLRHAGGLLPGHGQSKGRIPSLSPNKVSIVLWIRVGDAVLLLGSDMEKPGWVEILQSTTRPTAKASVFKIPHHGSANADEPEVWRRMLETDPWALLAPWRRGGRALPNRHDVQRILSCTPNAYSTAQGSRITASRRQRDRMVDRTLRESGIQLRPLAMSPGAVRLRRLAGNQAQWRVETFGSAGALRDFAA